MALQPFPTLAEPVAPSDVMHSPQPHITLRPPRAVPAWTISIALHLATIIVLACSMQSLPRGGFQAGNSISLVLNSASNDEPGSGGGGNAASQNAVEQPPAPPPLLETPPATIESPPVAAASQSAPVRLASIATATPNVAASAALASSSRQQSSPLGNGTGRGGSGNGRGTRGGDATISVFGVAGKGSRFVYLFDRSASMEGAPLAAAKRQLLQSLQSLGSLHQFHIIFFNSTTQPFINPNGTYKNAFATEINKQLAANFVGGITADGGTDRMVALREAVACAPDVIFFLTDADDPMSASELAELDRLNRRVHAAICVIEFGRAAAPSPDNFLMRLARASGGQYGYVDTTTLTR